MAQVAAAEPAYHVQVLERAFRIIDVLAEVDRELGATELAEKLRLHKSTTHRLLVILERRRYIEKNPENAKYRLGWRLFELGALAVSRLDLYAIARPYVQRLVEETGETAHVGVLRGGEIISVVNVESQRNVRTPSTVGRRSPLYCTSQGKAMLAFMPEDRAAELIRGIRFKAFTRNTISRPARLKAELELIRERGYAMDDEEFDEGLRCIGAPVRDHLGDVVAAISIAGPAFRVGGDHMPVLIDSVLAISRQLSAALGFQRSPSAKEGRGRRAPK